MASVWNPWVGCKKYSEGCAHCYIEKGAIKHGYNFNDVHITKDFYKPIEKNLLGEYKMKSGFAYLCFQSDFFIEEADEWRKECYKMIKERQDITFLLLTKRIDRFYVSLPDDWGEGYPNLIICCTVENQAEADKRLSVFSALPIKVKMIAAQPLLENIEIEKYLDNIDSLEVGGEQDSNGRIFDYEWALNLQKQCIAKNVNFHFRQVGSHYKKNGTTSVVPFYKLSKLAREENLDYIKK